MTGAERARRSRDRRLAELGESYREAERERAREYHRRTFVPAEASHGCARCGVPTHHRGYCSARECQLERNRVRQIRYMHERRARKYGNGWERFDPAEVYERDAWTCGICGDPVDRAASFPHPLSVSLDHVVPISLGGPHTRDNTRCSHLLCNTARGNRVA